MMTWLKTSGGSVFSSSKAKQKQVRTKYGTPMLPHPTRSSSSGPSSSDELAAQSRVDKSANLCPMNDSFAMEDIFRDYVADEPSYTLYQNNPELTAERRCRIINWLLEMAVHYGMHNETLFLTAYYFDRYMTVTGGNQRAYLQLISIACLMIAAKIEEIYPPTLPDYAEACEHRYTLKEMADAELEVLKALNWNLSFPSVYKWLCLYCERLLDPLVDGLLFDMSARLLRLTLHHPQAAVFSFQSLAATALAIVVGVPRVRAATSLDIDLQQLDWMMQLLQAPSVALLADTVRLGRVKKKKIAERGIEKGPSDLDFMLTTMVDCNY